MSGPGLPTRVALSAIRGYQRFLSPHKGFSCALRAATGAAGCSAYGHAVIARFGLRRGLGLLRRRLALCTHAHLSNPRPAVASLAHPRRKYQRGSCDLPCDLPDLSCHGLGDCGVCDAVSGPLECVTDVADCWPTRRKRDRIDARRSTAQLAAVTERIRSQQARRRSEVRGDAAGSSPPADE